MAQALGVSLQTFARWERGLVRPSREHSAEYAALMERIERALAAFAAEARAAGAEAETARLERQGEWA
jgi:DNA-binding XRE family transcriptional regulator